jgi:dipeptidyl aminopeptidase/acylaminoacyl peptidase
MRPEDLDKLFSLSKPAVADDYAIIAATRPDFDSDTYTGQLWKVALSGETAPLRFTRGFHDDSPKLSPDGKLVAFLRNAAGKRPQLAVVEAGGGEPLVLTDQLLGVSEFAFTPDSQSIVFAAPVAEEGRYGTVEGVTPVAEDPRHITSYQFQMNGQGYVEDKRIQVFALEIPDLNAEPPIKPTGRAAKALKDTDTKPVLFPVATQLTSDNADHTGLATFADQVVFLAALQENADELLTNELYTVALEGGEPKRLTHEDPEHQLLIFPPVVAGEWIFFIGQDNGASGQDFVAKNGAIYRVPLGGGVPERLTEPENTEFVELASAGANAEHLLGIISERGLGVPVKVGLDGTITRIAAPDSSATWISGNSGNITAIVSTWNKPAELALLDVTPTNNAPKLLTNFSAALQETGLVKPQEFISTSADGYEIQGWVLLPEGAAPHPVLLNIHGGPYGSYTPTFFDEVQVYVQAGYAVLYCNPRGSSSYGQAHGAAIKDDFGNLDTLDVLNFLDNALAAFPSLDSTRVGVMGGSYGGYLSAWLVGHTDRFSGAIVERAYLDPRSFIGSSDIGWFFVHGYNTNDPVQMDAQSPTMFTKNVTTPTLVLHSEQDLRCPLSQALRYYTELKQNGVAAELLVFPGETHELSRSGRPWHRKQRFDAILEWWLRWL